MQVEMWTKGPSFPRQRDEDTAKIAPRDFTISTGRERKEGMEKPERMVFISGMPEPEARYIVLPWTVDVVGGLEEGGEEEEVLVVVWPLLAFFVVGLEDEVDGRVDRVNMVKLELMMPKAIAMAT